MNGSLKTVASIAAIALGLGVSISETRTEANLNVSEWQLSGSNNITTVVSGVTELENCPLELVSCEVAYSGDVNVELNIVDNKLQFSPAFSLSEVSYVELPVGEELESEVESEVSSEL